MRYLCVLMILSCGILMGGEGYYIEDNVVYVTKDGIQAKDISKQQLITINHIVRIGKYRMKAVGGPKLLYVKSTPCRLYENGKLYKLDYKDGVYTRKTKAKRNTDGFSFSHSVNVKFDEAGWIIYLDGEIYRDDEGKLVTAPAVIMVPQGEHVITLRQGNRKISQTINPSDTRTIDLSKGSNEQEPLKFGRAYIRTEPSGAVITEGDKKLGTSPVLVKLSYGLHEVVANKDGFEPTKAVVLIRDGSIHKPEVLRLEPDLVPVDVIATKEWPIYVDGKPYTVNGHGVEAPATIKVSPGKHRISVRQGRQMIYVDIKDGQRLVDLSDAKEVKAKNKASGVVYPKQVTIRSHYYPEQRLSVLKGMVVTGLERTTFNVQKLDEREIALHHDNKYLIAENGILNCRVITPVEANKARFVIEDGPLGEGVALRVKGTRTYLRRQLGRVRIHPMEANTIYKKDITWVLVKK